MAILYKIITICHQLNHVSRVSRRPTGYYATIMGFENRCIEPLNRVLCQSEINIEISTTVIGDDPMLHPRNDGLTDDQIASAELIVVQRLSQFEISVSGV